MAKQTVNIGTTANDRTGDNLRTAFNKINANFTELYTTLGLDSGGLNLGAFEFTGSVMSTTDSSAVIIDQAVTVTSDLTVGGDIVPSVANGGDLGSLTKPWRSLYVSGDTVFIGGTPVRINENGDLTVDGNVVASGDVSYNDLTNKPTIPADIGDLTDTGNLLSGDTGNWTFSSNTLSENSTGNAVIQSSTFAGSKLILQTRGPTDKQWIFDQDGGLTFPDDTVQTTAWTGTLSSIDSIGFDTSAGVSVTAGQLAWNSSDGTLDLGTGYADVVLQIGQETHFVVRNATGSTIPNGTAVYCSGVTVGSARIEASPFVADNTVDSTFFLGIATHSITNGVNGVVTHFGYVRGLDTRGTEVSSIAVGDETWAVGDKLYTHPTVAGKLTKVEPTLPYQKICVASIMSRHQSSGVLFVRPTQQIPTDLSELTNDSGFLTAVTSISSEDAVEIRVNLTDSTTRVWRFGEDGSTTFPGSITFNGALDFTNADSIQNFAPGDIYAKNGEFLYVTSRNNSGSATNVAFTYDTNINNVKQTFYGKTEFSNNGQAPIVDFTGATVTGLTLDVAKNIESENDVNITINNDDSSTYTWNFGQTGDLTFPDSTVQLTAYPGPQTTLDGDVTGSVFSDGSTLLVDGVDGKIVGDVETARLRTSEIAIALGSGAGEITQGVRAVAIGEEAGRTDQGVRAVAIGYYAGQTNQSATAVAIGDEAGNTNQGVRAVAIGYLAGGADQGTNAVAIGDEAGQTSQGNRAVAIGVQAGETSQGVGGVAIGEQAGQTAQGVLSVAIGYYAGSNTQSFSAVAIGAQAGETAQGSGAIAIGDLAGQTAQGNNSIVINATGVALNNTVANTFVVKPVRAAAGTSILQYDASTGEITHTNDIYSDQQISITVSGEDSTSKTWYFGNDGDLTAPGDLILPPSGVITTANHQLIVGTQAFDIRTAIDTAGTGYDLTIGPGNTGTAATASADLILRGGGTSLSAIDGGDVYINAGGGGIGGTNGDVILGNEETASVQIRSILKIDDGVQEKFQALADATGTVTHDCSSGHIFYHTSPDANWTVNLTNLDLSTAYATSVTIVVVQGDPAYYPSALEIAGSAQTINWQGGSSPTPTADGIDVVTFSILNNSGTYTVLGQLTDFSTVA